MTIQKFKTHQPDKEVTDTSSDRPVSQNGLQLLVECFVELVEIVHVTEYGVDVLL